MTDQSHMPGIYDWPDREDYRIVVEPDLDAANFSPLTWDCGITKDDDEYKQWARGDVFGVIVQRLDTFTNERTGEKHHDWVEVESLWDCYLRPDYTGLMVARDLVGE